MGVLGSLRSLNRACITLAIRSIIHIPIIAPRVPVPPIPIPTLLAVAVPSLPSPTSLTFSSYIPRLCSSFTASRQTQVPSEKCAIVSPSPRTPLASDSSAASGLGSEGSRSNSGAVFGNGGRSSNASKACRRNAASSMNYCGCSRWEHLVPIVEGAPRRKLIGEVEAS